MPFTQQQNEALAADMPAGAIRTRKDFASGAALSYVEGWYVIDKANELFGYDGWEAETARLEQTSRDLGTDSKGKEQWQVSYVAVVRVAVMAGDRQIVREGTGYGSGYARKVGDAIEGAAKEAETDALKRALRTFGNQFGNALYDKDKANVEGTQANIEKLTKAKARPLYEELSADIGASGDVETLAQWAKDRKADIDKMPDDWRQELKREYAARRNALVDS